MVVKPEENRPLRNLGADGEYLIFHFLFHFLFVEENVHLSCCFPWLLKIAFGIHLRSSFFTESTEE